MNNIKPCKICGSNKLNPHCAVDFNELYEKNDALGVSKSGPLVYYLRCSDCRFTFTTFMDDWSNETLSELVYNDEYLLIDGDYKESRPKYNFERFIKNFNIGTDNSLLDYGGGNGIFVSKLKEAGLKHGHTWDPFDETHTDMLHEKYDFVTSFEVIEHSTEPIKSFDAMFSHLKPYGIAVVSTLCIFDSPGNYNTIEGMTFLVSYMTPRAGHVSIFSIDSLKKVADRYGLTLLSLDIGYHIFYNNKYTNAGMFLKDGAR